MASKIPQASFPQAMLRAQGFALLRPATRPQLDSARIVTLSGTIAINLIAMGLLMMPLAAPPPAAWEEPRPDTQTRWLKKEPPKVEIVKIETPRLPSTAARPATRPAVAPTRSTAIATPMLSETGTEPASANNADADAVLVAESIAPVSMAPAPAHLEYARAPAPKYPRNALRLGLTGTVTLQVLVGIDGSPLDVSVVKSSGHRELDEAARAQVLKRWSFRPATRDGIAIQAIGFVPVQFSLQR